METHQLKAQIRTATGKGAARTLRSEGKMPAILYGSDFQSVPLAVSTYDIEHLLDKINYAQALLHLVVENGQSYEKTVMIKEIQTDPFGQEYLHVDFYEVKMDQKITATVPVTTRGVSRGVEEGGILQIIRRELDVVCFPGNIPQQIEIDITELEVGDSVHIEDVPLEEDVEIPYEKNFTIVTVVSPKVVEEEVEEVEEEEGVEEEGAEEEEAKGTEEKTEAGPEA